MIESQIGCMTDLIVAVIIEILIFTEIIHFAIGYFNLMIIGQRTKDEKNSKLDGLYT